jgi:spermidine synthase
MMFSSFFILLPVSFSHGALFTSGCAIVSHFSGEDASAIGRVYIFEIIGTAAGGIILTYALIPFFRSFQIAFMIIILNGLSCLYLLNFAQKKWFGWSNFAVMNVIVVAVSVTLLASRGSAIIHWNSIKGLWKNQEVLFSENSQYGNVTVTGQQEQYTFFANGTPIITVPSPNISHIENFVHFPLLIHPNPKRILIISGGAGGVISEVLKHAPERVDYVELDPLILTAIQRFPTSLTQKELQDPRTQIIFMDGRRFLKKTANTYDVIFIGLSDPSDLQTNRLYTEEFFSLSRSRLTPGGFITVQLPGSLSYLSNEMKKLNICILTTLRDEFSSVAIIPGDVNFFIARNNSQPFRIDPDSVKKRLAERDISIKLFTPFYIDYRLHTRWLNWFIRTTEGTAAKKNNDFLPAGVLYSLNLWNAKFSPRMTGFFNLLESFRMRDAGIFTGMLIVLFILFHFVWKERSVNWAIPVSIGTTGFAGMMFDLILIFSFQVLYGYVYYLIGLLITAFMAGSGTGSWVMTSRIERIKNDKSTLLFFEAGIIVFSGLLPLFFLWIIPSLEKEGILIIPEIGFFLLCFAGGFFVGFEFPLANKINLKRIGIVGKSAGYLNAADLIGGFIGGMFGSILLLPVLGLLGTCGVIVMGPVKGRRCCQVPKVLSRAAGAAKY